MFHDEKQQTLQQYAGKSKFSAMSCLHVADFINYSNYSYCIAFKPDSEDSLTLIIVLKLN